VALVIRKRPAGAVFLAKETWTGFLVNGGPAPAALSVLLQR
jgi:hypothetical protein